MSELNVRLLTKHAKALEWETSNLVILDGEMIIYDPDETCSYARIKIGNGSLTAAELPFVDDSHWEVHRYFNAIINNKILNIEYDTLLAFDTSEIVIGGTSSSSILGRAILGQLILA